MGPFGPELLITRTQVFSRRARSGRRSNVGMVLGRDFVRSCTVLFGPPNVQL